jgi:hypothetical protein
MARKLILVALIALVVCTGFGFKASCTAPATQWRLTISSTEGGSVPIPGEGVFWYDVDKATTIIVMDLDYTVQANFAPVSHH